MLCCAFITQPPSGCDQRRRERIRGRRTRRQGARPSSDRSAGEPFTLRRCALRCSLGRVSRSRSTGSSSTTRARARSASGCSPAGSATPTSTSATASGSGPGRSSSVTKGPGSSRRSARSVDPVATGLRVGDLVALSWMVPCGAAEPAGPAGSGSAPTRRRSVIGRDGASTRLHGADGTDVLAYLAIGTIAEAHGRPGRGRHPDAGGHPGRGRRAHRLLRLDRRRSRDQDRRRPGRGERRRHRPRRGRPVGRDGRPAGRGRHDRGGRPRGGQARARPGPRSDRRRSSPATIRPRPSTRCGHATDGGPDFAFEAIGLPVTIEQAIAVLPPGGTAVLVGMTPLGERAAFDVFPFVDGSRPILGSNYGSAVAAGRLPALRRALPSPAAADRAAHRAADRAGRRRGRVRPAPGRRRPAQRRGVLSPRPRGPAGRWPELREGRATAATPTRTSRPPETTANCVAGDRRDAWSTRRRRAAGRWSRRACGST